VCPVGTVACATKVVSLCECGLRKEEVNCGGLAGRVGAVVKTLTCNNVCEAAARQALLKAAFLHKSTPGDTGAAVSVQYFEHLLELGAKWQKYLVLIEQTFREVSANKTHTLTYLPGGCLGRRALAVEYAQTYWRMETGCSGGQVWVRHTPKARNPVVLLSDVLSLPKEQRTLWTLSFDESSPSIFVYDLVRAADTAEKVSLVLEEFVGEFRVRRGTSRALSIDFVDAEKALRAFRRLRANELDSNLKRCELRNVPLVATAEANDVEIPDDQPH
jgi:hypothetical protein